MKKEELLIRQFITELFASHTRGGRQNEIPGNIVRDGAAVRTQPWSLGAPVGAKKLQHAAVSIVTDPLGRFLGVSRMDNPYDFGFPGGNIEDNESPEQAAARELEEETGLSTEQSKHIVTLQDGGKKVHFYAIQAAGEIDTPETGVVKWVMPAALTTGTFGDQNKIIMRILGIST